MSSLQRVIESMEEKGLQEDPRYSQLLALRARQSNMGEKQAFTAQQLHQLRYVTWNIYYIILLIIYDII